MFCQNCNFVRSVARDGKGVMKMGSEVCHYGESIDNRDDASLTHTAVIPSGCSEVSYIHCTLS
jgi:hypothetical protein